MKSVGHHDDYLYIKSKTNFPRETGRKKSSLTVQSVISTVSDNVLRALVNTVINLQVP
jgi:hypothetical protein